MLNAHKRVEWKILRGIFMLLLGLTWGCGPNEDQSSQELWHTGAAWFRGHEDLTRMGIEKANRELQAALGYTPFARLASGIDASCSDNPLVRGNYQSDFPTSRLRQFYGVSPAADWHAHPRLQVLHALRNAGDEGKGLASRAETCSALRKLIVTAARTALEAQLRHDSEEALFWTGHALHAIQDAFSPAHTRRSGAEGRELVDFCSYGKREAGVCFHEDFDKRDRIWRANLSCTFNPQRRGSSCLVAPAQWAADASGAFLSAMGEILFAQADLESRLDRFFSAREQRGAGAFVCPQ